MAKQATTSASTAAAAPTAGGGGKWKRIWCKGLNTVSHSVIVSK